MVERLPCKQDVRSSILLTGTISHERYIMNTFLLGARRLTVDELVAIARKPKYTLDNYITVRSATEDPFEEVAIMVPTGSDELVYYTKADALDANRVTRFS